MRSAPTLAGLGVILGSATCHAGSSSGSPSTSDDSGLQSLALTVSSVDTRIQTEHFIASIEMQISGEPFAHGGPAKTDSGFGNASLLLSAPIVSTVSATPGSATPGVLLRDVGTCVTSGPWPDVAHDDIAGDPRPACAFDTPALRGLADSAPHMHDGSASTLEAAIAVMLGAVPQPAVAPSADDLQALAEYLRGL